ncbi:MAG TPA: inositol monophosphatase family protein [Fimbriimonadaceae bacterium]|nr:inositol monophosphatase family protein [Fimbriimonadaceae bacterium]
MSPRLEFAIETAYRAGRLTLGLFQTGTPIHFKADDSPVTEADRQAERLIRDAIAAHYPGEAILGEEEGLTGAGDTRWVLDPIDGTKSFVSGVPLFSTLLSFEEGGVPVLGVVVLPALNEVFAAERGGGSTWNGRPCRVRSAESLDRATIATGSASGFRATGRWDGLGRLSDSGPVLRTWGDAYGHMLVASGRIDAMVDPIVERWDLSAVAVIVEEAGGRFTDFDGRSGIHREAISSTPEIHRAVLEAFQ